ncbi:pirin family protein [Marinilabilia sp.]|jgi:redox-sensitive bicupin YhaK (pirin superfamily)
MKKTIHRNDTRGHADHGWLDTYHTFSFANYYDPHRIQFGALRVLNDDTVQPGMGFGKHPHDNMEIITIPLFGDLEHKDSMGNEGVIKEGDVQVMSAGKGIFHSEKNHNRDKEVQLLQIWVLPNKQDVEPRYDQISIRELSTPHQFYQILSPDRDDQGVWIHQDAWFSLAELDAGKSDKYRLKGSHHGVYLFVIEGQVKLADEVLDKRDGIGISEVESIKVEATKDSRVLIMEVPV